MTIRKTTLALAVCAIALLTGCTAGGAKITHDKTPTTAHTASSPSVPELHGIQYIAANGDDLLDGFTINGIDPKTGKLTRERTFNAVPGAQLTIDTWTAFFERQSFDPQLHRVTARAAIAADGSLHVGWVTDTGTFVDVSAVVHGDGAGFSGRVVDTNPTFGADGAFYYIDRVANTIVKVSTDHPTSAADAKVVVRDIGTVTDMWVFPSGTIRYQDGAMVSFVENTTKGAGGAGKVEDWLTATTMLSTNVTETQIYLSDADPLPIEFSSCMVSGSCNNRRPLLPERTGRLSWNPVASRWNDRRIPFRAGAGNKPGPTVHRPRRGWRTTTSRR